MYFFSVFFGLAGLSCGPWGLAVIDGSCHRRMRSSCFHPIKPPPPPSSSARALGLQEWPKGQKSNELISTAMMTKTTEGSIPQHESASKYGIDKVNYNSGDDVTPEQL